MSSQLSYPQLREEMRKAICDCDDHENEFAAEKVDLRKVSDKAKAEQSVHILVRLGPRIREIILSLVQGQRKWLDGAVARAPVRVKNSLLQGCPTSMLLMAAQAALWVKNVKAEVQSVDIWDMCR